ncbi:MAG: transcriptional regulator [Robiginitomaculum sp.]|nr:MAG: transcriptional regulator [Robiginitomaculum sp.]
MRKNPEVLAEYDRLTPEYAVAHAMIKARAEAGLTQAALAKKAGITQAQVARIEGGQWPQPKTLMKLAKALGKTPRLEFV